MNKNLLPIHFAPLQGYTDAVYRQAHARIFGGIETYYSPFARVEHGEIRSLRAKIGLSVPDILDAIEEYEEQQ